MDTTCSEPIHLQVETGAFCGKVDPEYKMFQPDRSVQRVDGDASDVYFVRNSSLFPNGMFDRGLDFPSDPDLGTRQHEQNDQ